MTLVVAKKVRRNAKCQRRLHMSARDVMENTESNNGGQDEGEEPRLTKRIEKNVYSASKVNTVATTPRLNEKKT